ncbi:pyroglutamyl-peptidase I [Negativibacillus massiliensis]|uniref:pyroglutamyl-peptidase I n=1 Tax=Negativibacillus massiliensis TaxID=1871035 RepID=UPI003AF24099
MKVVVTGFQPFGKETMNPSFEAVRLLPDEIKGAQIVKKEIPVVFRKGGQTVQEIVRAEKPDIVILVGQAGGRTSMNVERVAINCEDCPTGFPDNEGNCPQGEKIYEDGPDAYFATVPVKSMVKKMMDNGVPAAISNTAGTYVCNDLMYHLLYQLKHEFPNARGGFIHVPYATIQNHPNMASMTIEEMSKGLALCVEAAIENEHDITAASGATH